MDKSRTCSKRSTGSGAEPKGQPDDVAQGFALTKRHGMFERQRAQPRSPLITWRCTFYLPALSGITALCTKFQKPFQSSWKEEKVMPHRSSLLNRRQHTQQWISSKSHGGLAGPSFSSGYYSGSVPQRQRPTFGSKYCRSLVELGRSGSVLAGDRSGAEILP